MGCPANDRASTGRCMSGYDLQHQIAADRIGVRRSRGLEQRSQVAEFLIELRFHHAVLLHELAQGASNLVGDAAQDRGALGAAESEILCGIDRPLAVEDMSAKELEASSLARVREAAGRDRARLGEKSLGPRPLECPLRAGIPGHDDGIVEIADEAGSLPTAIAATSLRVQQQSVEEPAAQSGSRLLPALEVVISSERSGEEAVDDLLGLSEFAERRAPDICGERQGVSRHDMLAHIATALVAGGEPLENPSDMGTRKRTGHETRAYPPERSPQAQRRHLVDPTEDLRKRSIRPSPPKRSPPFRTPPDRRGIQSRSNRSEQSAAAFAPSTCGGLPTPCAFGLPLGNVSLAE